MKHATLAWFAALVAGVVSQSQSWGNWGSIPSSSGLFSLNSRDLGSQSQNFQKYGGLAGQSSAWAGQNLLKNNAQQQNANQQQEKAQASNQNFGLAGSSFSNAAKLISDEARRNQQAVIDDTRYKSVDNKAAAGGSAADVKKAAFNSGDVLNDKIDYAYKNNYNKLTGENGGFETEDSRSASRSDVIKEKEKDYNLQRAQDATSRAQDNQQQAFKEAESKTSAAQKQAQDGKYGFADRNLNQAGENSDGRAIEYGRKDSRDVDQEAGRQEASRLAKDITEHAAGYQNEAAASADANKKAADNKYFGGAGTGPYGEAGTGGFGGYNGIPGNTGYYPIEAAGGSVGSGFSENSAQKQKANELGSDKALTAAQSLDDYNLNKDKASYNEIKGLKDYNQGAFKQGLNDNSAQGFAGSNAEAAKAAYDYDKKQAAAKSSASLAAADKSEKLGLKDRDYERVAQQDENEKVNHKQSFFNNKVDSGNTDEFLKYDRQKNANQFGNAEQASAAKEDKYNILQQNDQAAAQSRKFEDFADSRANAEKENGEKAISSKGFEQQSAQDAARAQAASSGFDKAAFQASKDDSQSGAYKQYQNLNDNSGTNRLSQQVKAAEVIYPQKPTYNNDELWQTANAYKPQVIPSYSASYGKLGSGSGAGYTGAGILGNGYTGTNVLLQRTPQGAFGYNAYPKASAVPSSSSFGLPYGTNSFGSYGKY